MIRRKFEDVNSERKNMDMMYELWRKTLDRLDKSKDLVLVTKYNERDPYIAQAYTLKEGTDLIHIEMDYYGQRIIIREASIDVPPRKYVIKSESDMNKWLDEWGF